MNEASRKLIENMMRSGEISHLGTSGRTSAFQNGNTHVYNEICNDGFCALWAAFEALGVVNKSDTKKRKLQKIVNYVVEHPAEFTNEVKEQLLTLIVENGPQILEGRSSSSWKKNKYGRISDPRTISFRARVNNIKINRSKPLEVSGRPALGSTFTMLDRIGVIVFVHNGTHWGLARPL